MRTIYIGLDVEMRNLPVKKAHAKAGGSKCVDYEIWERAIAFSFLALHLMRNY